LFDTQNLKTIGSAETKTRHASTSSSVRMHKSRPVAGFLFRYSKSISGRHAALSCLHSHHHRRSLLSLLLLLLPSSSSALSNGRVFVAKRGLCGYAAEQFSDDEYECDFENHTVGFGKSDCFVLFQLMLFSDWLLISGVN
jgi:hypothetical protein